MVAAPNPTYVGPAKWHGGSNNKPIKRIVIHATVGAEPGVDAAAKNVISYAKSTSRPSSFHYIADDDQHFQYVYDSIVAYHAPPNGNSLGYELCCSLSNKGKGHWGNAEHQRMLRIAAKDVAQLCLAYDIPIRKLTSAQVKSGAKGICGHVNVSEAFKQSSHWDPGPYFPWVAFIRMVQTEAANLTDKKTIVFPKNSHDVKFRHMSCQWSDTDAQTRADIDLIFSSLPHVITFTEVGKGQNPAAQRQIEKYGDDYWFYFDNRDAGVAIKKTMGKRLDSGYIKVIPGVSGDHPDAGIAWLQVQNPKLGKITVASTHYITGDRQANRRAQNNKIAAALGELAEEKGAGASIFFFGGDFNRDDATQDLVPNTRLTTVWDELGKYPDTLKTVTFDALGSFDPDGRVRAKSGRTLVSKFHTDHIPVEAIFNIQEL
jgi:hypothetical protein